ncbi:hypothetical protein C1631_011695 [Chryseobacterium phosphatilyticum]|uniref:Lipoprotein n=1 Tax=Chryseobacterium phosphatilyticum TaxID=475075 RepID=A0A316XAR3_9FLAO|nr:hypothetical protein [Chryseobacterium phosphatilyticum]PWN70614.1 hypothetical protein C1631_011695 [Chryseobacterium phosphatilyticum]
MKSNLIFSVLLTVGLISCTSEKAVDFKKEITAQEQIVFNALINKEGYETEKSLSIIKRDYDRALSFINKEEQLFDSVIKHLSILSDDHIKEGAPVKTAAISYYKAMKDLFLLDRQSIQQQKITFSKDIRKVDKAQDSILQISRKKLEFHKIVEARNMDLQKALEKFDQANNIK